MPATPGDWKYPNWQFPSQLCLPERRSAREGEDMDQLRPTDQPAVRTHEAVEKRRCGGGFLFSGHDISSIVLRSNATLADERRPRKQSRNAEFHDS